MESKSHGKTLPLKTVPFDLVSGIVVFLVALPLCLGVALASNAPLFSGLLAGIIGGIVVGCLSGSNTSVSGPAAGLTAIVAVEIGDLGSFEAFLAAVVLAGIIQIILSIAKLGNIASFFPSSVIKGLLSAIGIILILKQIPHLLGHDSDPIGNKSFYQLDNNNTFTELFETWFHIHPGAALVGIISLILFVLWEKTFLKKTYIPAPLAVVIIGVLLSFYLKTLGGNWEIGNDHLVQVPVASTVREFFSFFIFPDWTTLMESTVYFSALTIAVVASLETLLNIEAVDKIDPQQRYTPPNRELLAQGVGNLFSGLVGGLPITSVIVRSSVNINSGAKTKLSAIWHGILLFLSILLVPTWLNQIPLSTLAAILFVTGLKLASPQLMKQMWQEGKNQFIPYIITVIAIVLSDILMGVLIGLASSIYFILQSNARSPIKKTMEKHATGYEVLHIELPNQVSFFNRASLDNTLQKVPNGGHVLIDANNTDYIDPDILDLITDYEKNVSKSRGIHLSLVGFKDRYPPLEDKIQFVDFSNIETQTALTPEEVLWILQEGNTRFREGKHIKRNLDRQLHAATYGQFPMAVILSCIDSRAPAEVIFDLGLGDVFSVRIAGNVISRKILGSIEYSCAVAGAKVIVVMGHTLCGAVKASFDLICSDKTTEEATGCVNLDYLIKEIQHSIDKDDCSKYLALNDNQKQEFLNEIAHKNVLRTISEIRKNSSTLDALANDGKIVLVGAMYDISNARVSFFQTTDPKVHLDKEELNTGNRFKRFFKIFKPRS
ncbi:Bicarbonate transporter BicA [Candidatus Rubidus massiliensis]|nr:Bicarbonate transporter BicA [Candidatus Rubidus massiliensis]